LILKVEKVKVSFLYLHPEPLIRMSIIKKFFKSCLQGAAVRKISILSILIIAFCSATMDEYALINSIAFPEATFFTTDNLGYAYVVVENQLLKFDSNGKPQANYSENNLGLLRFVDASNPMKTFLFYPDFARIIILDSKLALQVNINLRSINVNQPMAACISKENGYWVYDREDDQIKKIDFNLQVIQQSGNLTQQIGYQLQPQSMVEEDGLLYLNNPATGILVFDRLATYFKTIPYPNLSNFQVIQKDVLFINKNKLYKYDSKSISEKEILIPGQKTIRSARIENQELYLLTNDSLKFYSF
jgi:hypothetical protein